MSVRLDSLHCTPAYRGFNSLFRIYLVTGTQKCARIPSTLRCFTDVWCERIFLLSVQRTAEPVGDRNRERALWSCAWHVQPLIKTFGNTNSVIQVSKAGQGVTFFLLFCFVFPTLLLLLFCWRRGCGNLLVCAGAHLWGQSDEMAFSLADMNPVQQRSLNHLNGPQWDSCARACRPTSATTSSSSSAD